MLNVNQVTKVDDVIGTAAQQQRLRVQRCRKAGK